MSMLDNLLTFGCCALILLLALYFGGQLSSEYKRLNALLTRLLEAFPVVGEDYDSQQRIVDAIEIVGVEDSVIKHSWSLYRRQWFSSSLAQQICQKDFASSCDAADFFNPISIFEQNRNWNMFRAMPSVLTGMGILFTFVGLTIGIAGVSGVSGFDNPEGIKQLLSGASLAFCTSIAGLFCSLTFTYFLKKAEHFLQVKLTDLVARMDWVFPIISTQQLNASTYTAVKENSQVAILLNDAIRDFGEKTQEEASSLIKALVDEFSAQLKEEIRNLGVVFDKALETSINRLDVTIDRFAKTVELTTQTRDQLNQELESIFKNYRELGEKIAGLDISLGTHTAEYERILQETESNLVKVSEHFKQLSTEQSQLMAASAAVSKQLAVTVEKMNSSMEGFDKSMKSAADMLTLSKECIEHLNNQGIPALKEMEENFHQITEANQQTVLEFRQTSVELTRGSDRLRKNMQATIDQADTQLAGAIQILSKAVKDWGNYQHQSVQMVAEAIERLEALRGIRK